MFTFLKETLNPATVYVQWFPNAADCADLFLTVLVGCIPFVVVWLWLQHLPCLHMLKCSPQYELQWRQTWLWTAAFISGPLGKWTRLDKIIGVMLSSLNVTGQVQTGGYAASCLPDRSLPHESLTPCPSGPWAEITLFCYSEETLTSRSWNWQDYLRLS